jgi:predicted nucleic acid-binding protein
MVAPRSPVLLDASVLVAASHSPSGGSAVALEACQGGRFRAAITIRVFLEARRNIGAKFSEADLVRFYQQLADLEPEVVPPPSPERIEYCASLTSAKDGHVLAAALECNAAYLLTLDRRHLLTDTVQAAVLLLKVMTPGEFLKGL